MRIGIDGGSWDNRRGYGRFLREIVTALGNIDHQHHFVIFLNEDSAREFPSVAGISVKPVRLGQSTGEAAKYDGNRSLTDLLRMSFAVRKEKLDVFWFPTLYSYFPILRRVPTVLGIHDTIADRNPDFAFAGARQRLFWKAKVKAAAFQADLVMTVSDYSRRCLTETLGIRKEVIRIVPEAASPMFRPPAPGIGRDPYVFYVGGISPNKNLGVLVQAFANLSSQWTLKLAGDYESDGFRNCFQEIQDLSVKLGVRDRVKFLGFVSDADLISLYQRASLFVLPSFDEGFGLPAIEAMASGVPVIVSQGNSLEEVVGDAGITFPMHDAAALSAAMQSVLNDERTQRRMSAAGMRRAAEYSWPAAAASLIRIVEEAACL